MFSHQLYNLVHVVGIVVLMLALGGIVLAPTAGGDAPQSRRGGRTVAVLHAGGLFLILLGGFGMLARLGIVRGTSWPGWVWVKVIVWVTLGVVAFLPYRFPAVAKPLLLIVPLLAGVAAYMAIYKPL